MKTADRRRGAPLLRFADLTLDEHLVQAARNAADNMLDAHTEAARAHMDRWLGGRAEFLRA